MKNIVTISVAAIWVLAAIGLTALLTSAKNQLAKPKEYSVLTVFKDRGKYYRASIHYKDHAEVVKGEDGKQLKLTMPSFYLHEFPQWEMVEYNYEGGMYKFILRR